jgi:1-acyl-sn-glycerol-3-phosphate acyltransferase
MISNHQNNFDIFVVGSFVTHHTVSVGKKVIKYFPFFGQIYWLSGNILIDRKKKKSAIGTMNQASTQIVQKKIRVWVMPEGTRSKGRGLLPFKKGAFYLSQQSDVPIIPVCISSYHNRLHLNSLKTITIRVKYLEPIDPFLFANKSVSEIRDETFHTFKKELASLDERTTQLKNTPC